MTDTAPHTKATAPAGEPTTGLLADSGRTAEAGAGDVLEVAGIGFGAANLALAIALHEAGGTDRARFLERQPSFGWHRGMLIAGSSLQVSFLKDLVTMRDPTSDFSFLSYLHHKGRLVDFINHQVLMPSRVEYHDYLGWCAGRLDAMVEYGVEVTGVRPVTERGEVVALDVLAGDRVAARARNLVVAAGLRPRLPADAETGDRVWHSARLLHELPAFDERPPRRAIVVGAGQSAAEVAGHLLDRYPEAEVCAVFARYGYTVADSSPFANRVFDPSAVDDFYAAPPEVRRSLLGYHGNTNYAAVDEHVLHDLYRRQYEQKVTGQPRLRVLHASRLTTVKQHRDGVAAAVEFLPTGEVTDLDADLLVYATGYEPTDPAWLLDGVADALCRDASGQLVIGRDYRLDTVPGFRCGIYVQGATESTHGIASTLLSMTAVRAGEIERSLARGRPGTEQRDTEHEDTNHRDTNHRDTERVGGVERGTTGSGS